MVAIVTVASFVAAGPVTAGEWPSRAVILVVPFGAGGGTDVMARVLAGPMAEVLGQDVIIENVTGAGGMIGSAHAARAAPDGYTILFGSRSAAIDMTLYKYLSYSLQNDLAPIVLVADQLTILVARTDLPVELVFRNNQDSEIGNDAAPLTAECWSTDVHSEVELVKG